MKQSKHSPFLGRATTAIMTLTKDIQSRALNTAGIKMESFGTENDQTSGTILAHVKQTLRDGGLAALVGRTSRVHKPGDHLRPIRMLEFA